jgi:hypothetical protein
VMPRLYIALLAATFGLCAVFAGAPARAELDTVIGPRSVVPNQPVSACSAKAKAALDAVLQNSLEAGAGSGEWLGVQRIDPSSPPSASAVIECHAVDTGYAVSFTCSAQIPPNPLTAEDLCNKLVAAFGAQSTATIGGGSASWH